MGLFGGKTKHYVASQSVPLIGSNDDPVKETLMKSILEDSGLGDTLLEDALNGTGIRINRAYRYGRDHYTYGLPEGHTTLVTPNRALVHQILQNLESVPVTLERVDVDYGEVENFVLEWLVANRGLSLTGYTLTPTAAMTAFKAAQYTSSYDAAVEDAATEANSIKSTIDNVVVTDDISSVVEFRDPDYYLVETNNRTTVTTTATVVPSVTVTDSLTAYYSTSESSLIDPATDEFSLVYNYQLNQTVTKDFAVNTEEITQIDLVVTETKSDASGVPVVPLDQSSTTTPGSPSTINTPTNQQSITTPTFNGQDSEIQVISYVEGELYYHASYSIPDGSGGTEYKRWNYAVSSGTYPELSPGSGGNLQSPFYPIVPFRRNNEDLTHTSKVGTDLYQTSERLVRKLDLNFADMGAGINDNPDIDEVDHAYLFFGTSITTENEAAIRYLAMFFEELSYTCPYTEATYNNALTSYTYTVHEPIEGDYEVTVPASAPPVWKINISDGGLKFELLMHYIEVTTTVGTIGPKGTATRVITPLTKGTVFYNTGDPEDPVSADDYERSYVTFTYQDTATTYKTIVVRGLVHLNFIYEHYKVTTNLEDAENGGLLIPLHYSVVKEMPLLARNYLFRDAFQMIFNSHVEVKVKWYQTGFFQFATIVVGFVYLAYTGDFSALNAAMAGGTAALAMYLLQQVVISIIWQQVFKVLAKALGAEWALVFAAVTAYMAQTGKLNTESLKGVPFAEDFLGAMNSILPESFTSGFGESFFGSSSSAFAGIQESIVDDFAELELEMESFSELMEEKNELLEEANKLLETSGIIDPYLFITSDEYNGIEKPDSFYTRTVHSGNPGALVFDAITYYADMMLELPKTNT